MKLKLVMATFTVLFVVVVAQAEAAIIWDYSPETTGASKLGPFRNVAWAQNFSERIQFETDFAISGMDIYNEVSTTYFVGLSVTVRLWTDDGGIPGSLIQEFAEAISIIDTEGVGTAIVEINRQHVDFTSPNAGAGTYWIGMSATSQEFGMMGLGGPNAPDDRVMYQMQGATPNFSANTGDMAFRLHGAVVPEPSTLAIWSLLGGIGLVAGHRRRRRKAA